MKSRIVGGLGTGAISWTLSRSTTPSFLGAGSQQPPILAEKHDELLAGCERVDVVGAIEHSGAHSGVVAECDEPHALSPTWAVTGPIADIDLSMIEGQMVEGPVIESSVMAAPGLNSGSEAISRRYPVGA
jgi:hypothetical protein